MVDFEFITKILHCKGDISHTLLPSNGQYNRYYIRNKYNIFEMSIIDTEGIAVVKPISGTHSCTSYFIVILCILTDQLDPQLYHK